MCFVVARDQARRHRLGRFGSCSSAAAGVPGDPCAGVALLVLFIMHAGALPGAVGFAIYNFGILGRIVAEVVENPVRARHRWR